MQRIFHRSWSYYQQWILAACVLLKIGVTGGRITLKQTRVMQFSEQSWEVEGVASLELDSNEVVYWFDCSSDESTNHLRWERIGGQENRFDVTALQMGIRLTVGQAQLKRENLGCYRCYHINTEESSVILLTSESPGIVVEREVVAAEINTTVSHLVHFSTYRGPTYVVRVTWATPNGGESLIQTNDSRIVTEETWSNFTLDRVTSQSSGHYNCTVTETRSNGVLHNASISIHLVLFVPATIVSPPMAISVKEGHNATFVCRAAGSPPPSIIWKRAGTSSQQELTHTQHIVKQETIIHDDSEGIGNVFSQIVLVDVSTEDKGVYLCVVQNALYGLEHTVQLNMTLSVQPREVPEVKLIYNNVSLVSHSVVLHSDSGAKPVFRCLITSGNSSSISWSISHSQSTPTAIRYTYDLTQSEQSLVWEAPVEPSDSGLYECVARNSFGEGRASVNLTVAHKPVIDGIIPADGLNIVSTTNHRDISFAVPVNYHGTLLTCIGYGWPAPTIQWTTIAGDGSKLPCGMESRYTYHGGGVVTAHLDFTDTQFNTLCVGKVQCTAVVDMLEDGLSQISHSVVLVQGTEGSETLSYTREFQLRIELPHPRKECSEWINGNSEKLKSDLSQSLTRTLTSSAEEGINCTNISLLTCSSDSLLVSGTLRDCQTTGAGLITMTTMLYTFLQWKNSGPLISINGKLYKVDPTYPQSLSSQECEGSRTAATHCQLNKISIGLYTACGVTILLFIVLVIVLFHQCRHRSCNCCHTPRHCHEKESESNLYS